MSVSRPERLLPYACVAAAACLFVSELQTTFKVQSTAGQGFCLLQASDRHHYAPLVLAVFAVVATIVAVTAGSKPAARAVAAVGILSLLLFLIVDLPHANEAGTLGTSCNVATIDFDAKAVPQVGFWLELLGALGLALTGAAFATLTPEQLREVAPRWLRGDRRSRGGPKPPGSDQPRKAVSEGERTASSPGE